MAVTDLACWASRDGARILEHRGRGPSDDVLLGRYTSSRPRPLLHALLKILRASPAPPQIRRATKPDVLNSRFLYFYLIAPAQQKQLLQLSEGSTVAHLNVADIRNFEMPTLPPIEEQRSIAATLGALDDKIDSNRCAIGLMEQHVLSRFQQLFDVQQDPAGFPISDLVHLNRRHKVAKGSIATYVGMSSLPTFFPVVDDWESKAVGSGQKFVNGDVLMARITPCLENGKTAVVDMLDDGEVGWGSTEYVVLSPRDEISTPWIYCLLRSEDVRGWAIRRMTGSSGRQRFSPDGFSQYRVPKPCPEALDEFNEEAIPMFLRMSQLRDESKKLEALRDSLLPELLSGRIRVPEAAAVLVSR
ncbi:hypothetical protein FEF26_09870 [Nesterenkonia salmonea]|uniref:Type I restriction modification DNA specificity domain-containing protein n=1 Tax=Nesterenkonia salmonea TaxID=1804987 RepID=A0A5R9BB55_9MICC|nr:restriction endonuclease subunit S [Nesterenkonia salmonea]TLP95817.1 hypothetical protein FEF26_09870 [Nesterenkonia salmonea]